MTEHILSPGDRPIEIQITPESAGWTYLDFSIISLDPNQEFQHDTDHREVALTMLAGSGMVSVGTNHWSVSRSDVFDEPATIVYVPPGQSLTFVADDGGAEFGLGGAPAEGRYPTRIFRPGDYKSEVRGGGASTRQVNHILAAPIPAERLVLYEVYVPRGTWSGWAPHCHDGYMGSPYLEETYYFRLDNNGFAMHRNWRDDTDFDEVLVAHDRDCVIVTQGFHSSVASPGSNMYFLNYLAGEPQDEERATPPYFHPDHTWIHDDWNKGAMELPTV